MSNDPPPREATRKRGAKGKLALVDGEGPPPANGEPGAISLYDTEGRKRPQSDVLLEIGSRHALFRDTAGAAFAQLWHDGHFEVHSVESKSYR